MKGGEIFHGVFRGSGAVFLHWHRNDTVDYDSGLRRFYDNCLLLLPLRGCHGDTDAAKNAHEKEEGDSSDDCTNDDSLRLRRGSSCWVLDGGRK